jgi:hypothetical protein
MTKSIDETLTSPADLDLRFAAERGAADDGAEHLPSEITYDEQRYPARPTRLRPSARRRLRDRVREALSGDPSAGNEKYVKWLVEESMLWDAKQLAIQLSGQGSMFQNPFAHPDPRAALERASVWFTAYPLSFMTRPGQSFLDGLADRALWQAFMQIGIDAVHTGPVKQAGGLDGWRQTPSVDGHFDRISMQVDPAFGTEEAFRTLCATAAEFDGVVIDDIVPGHTGKGADFRLAEMGYADYPGIYHMVSIAPQDWHLLPDVPEGQDSANLDAEAEGALERCGYIIGRLQRVIFYESGFKETNWSATRVVTGVDGVDRRWVYLHYFKAGQPSINWLDPSFAGMRLVIGDALHALADLGSGAPPRRQWLPRRREERRGPARVVGGPPALRGGQPAHREHDPQDGRLLLPGAEPHDGRHQDDVAGRRRPLLRLRHAPRLPPRARHGRHGVPAAHATPRA